MTDTRSLIDQLASNARPVRPLASPLRRTLLWACLAALVIAVLVASLGLRPGVMSSAPRVVEWTGSLLTALMAAYAVFQISVPGRSPSWAWLPLAPLLLWLVARGWGCAGEFLQSGGQGVGWGRARWQCG